jgi:hypothetical protein
MARTVIIQELENWASGSVISIAVSVPDTLDLKLAQDAWFKTDSKKCIQSFVDYLTQNHQAVITENPTEYFTIEYQS